MDNNDSRKWLYESLKGKGYDLGSYDEFDSHADEADTRKWLYETARESGFDMGSYEDFDKGIGYLVPRQEETNSTSPQTMLNTFSPAESEYPSLKEMADVSRFAPIDFSQNTEVNAMSPYSVESLGSRLQQLKKDGKLDMIIHQKEERELDRIYSPKKVENETDALENYRGRFRLTERGKFLNEELDGIRKEIADRYTNEYLASDRYKQLSSRYSGKQLNEEIDKDFQQLYGDQISKDMAPYMDAYNQQVFNRYDVGIQDDLTTLAKGRTINQVADLRRDIEQELGKTQPEINAPAGSAFIPSSAYGAAQRYGNVQSKEQQDRYTSLVAAKNLLDEADDIGNEASKKGNTTFLGGFSRGVRDKGFDVNTWAMGVTDTAYGSLLRKAAQKSDRGEELSSEEKKLLEAAAVNMATQAYFASDLGRGYKAGGTSAQSIPFMLEFALNPVSGSGNAIAKGILKYGAKRFGLKALESSAVKNGLKVGSRLAGDAVAAAGMTATSGLGHVTSGAQERMLGDVQFNFNEDGKVRYTGRENQMSDGDAWLRSTLLNTLENQSEMVFNAFKGVGSVVGVSNTGNLFPGIERFSALKAGELYRAIKNNPTYRKLAERTQFHGMPEEYFEEVYNNLVSLPLGEGSWEESTDIDNNIDTFLGVAPTSIVMSMLGLGSVAKESYFTRRNRERFEKTLSQDELSFFKDLKQRIKDGNIEDAREFVKLTLSDKKLTSEQKKEEIRYVYDMLQENTIEAVRNAETEDAIQKETDDIVNSSNQADGTVTECNRITTNEIGETVLVPGHIVGWMGGTIIENADGTQSREGGQPIWQPIGSKERITLHEGEYDPESIKSMPTKDMMEATAEMMREEAQKKAEMESKYDLNRINPPHADMDFIDKDGNKYHIVDKNPNGGWIAEAFSVDEKGNPTSQMVEITDEEYYDTMQAQLDAQEEAANIQEESSNLSENQAENEIFSPAGENIVTPNEVPDAIAEVNPAPEPIQEQKPALPVDEKGNILYHKMPVEDTIADLTDGALDDNEIDGFIAANKAEAGKLLKKVSESAPKISTNKAKYLSDKKAWQEKVADAQARVDYWNSIGEEIAAFRVQPGDKTAEAILSMGEPLNGEELAAMMLGTGRLPILYDSYKKETGGRNAEARGMVGLFATKANGGLSIEEAGEQLMLADQENGTHFFDENDPNAGRNAIIDVLSGARTRGDLFGFIQRNREALAERERQAELEAYEQTIARLAEASHMTPEEFIAFEENIAQMLEERLKDIPDEELKSIFAELYLDENYGRSRESDEVGTGVPEGEERVGSNEGSPGVLSEERGDNAGASEYSEERPELDDEIRQSGDGVLSEADAVDGREEVAPIGIGPFGNIYTQFKGKAKEAIAFLLGKKSGEAIGALHHPDIGEIDLVWGKVGTGKSNGFGLSKLAEYHPEVLDNLQELLNEMKIVKRSENRINLESNTHKAAIRLEWDGVRKNWLLTAFEKEAPTPIDKTTDTGENPNDLQSDTALLQDVSASSENKDSNVSENKQENAGFVSPSRIEGEPILDYAARMVESKRVHDAGSEVDTTPTEAQKEAGNYKKGHVKIDGFDITIENPKGSVRSGVDADGKPWSVTMNNTYGYIRGTESVDGDHIDVFLGDSGNKVYVVDQVKPDGSFDEHKVMYGFNSMEEATEAYLSNYSPGWQGLGAISEVSKESFKKWIDSSHRKTKPFVDYKSVKVENGGETVVNLPESNPIVSSKKSELGIEIPAMTEEEYIASEGYGFSGIGDVALHKGKQRTSKQQDKIVESQAKKDEDYARHREILRKTYRDKLSKGELREPSTIEKLLKTANGNPDNESTQAARRTLQKRGIDWQENSVRFRETVSLEGQDVIEETNERFNEELKNFTEENADKVHFNLGMPSAVLVAGGVENKPIKLYGSKLLAKVKKHGFTISELHNLPLSVASPIAVFNNIDRKGNRSVLTELKTENGNFLVTIDLGKGEDADFDIVSSVFGKNDSSVVNWINKGYATYIDKEKALNYLHLSAPIAEASNSSELSSATKIVESFENPTIEQGKIVSEVESLADSLHTPVRAVKSAEELPEGDVTRKRIENGDGIKGWFDTKSEEMAIYLPNATSVEDARESVFHEVVGHYGLRKLFGEDFNTFLDNVYANVSPEIRKQIVARAKERGNILDLREATEEYLATLAERGFDSVEERTLWQKIKDAFIDMLRKAGVHLGFDLTDNELRYVLWKSYQNLESQSIMDRAADIDMQRRLRVGNFRENETELHYSELKKEADRLKELTGRDVNLGRNEEEIAFMMSNDGADAGTIDHVRNTFARAREEGKKFFGFFDADTGKVYLCADQIDSVEILYSVWAHENGHNATFHNFAENDLSNLYDILGEEDLKRVIPKGYFEEALPKSIIADEYLSRILADMLSDKELFNDLTNKNIETVLEEIELPNEIILPYLSRNLKYIFNEGKENYNRKNGSGDGVVVSGRSKTSSKESIQGETEKRFRTGEPTGKRQRATGKVDKSTLSLNDSAFRMSKWEKIREAYQDGMISVKLMQDYLAQKTGKAIPEWMDVYLYENSKSGRSGYRMEQFHKKLYAPLMQEAGRLMQEDRNNGSSVEEAARLLDVYMKAKHGLEERNERMRREAMLKKINSIKDEDAKSVALQEMGESGIQDIVFSDESLEKFRVNLLLKDYSGLIGLAGKDENGNDKSMPEVERYAREAISTYEANHDTKKLWELVKDVSEYALKEEYEGGLIDRETYEAIRDMYKYYIPLRGRSEKTAEDFFSYIERGASDTGFENVIKKAYGHTYESGNAFAYLAKMAETAIVQSEKNRVKQRLLWMARNYRDPSIMEIANVWYVKDSEGQWVEKVPELAGTEGEQKQAMAEFNQQMEELQKEGKAKRKLEKVDIGVPISTYQAQEHQVRVKENGREYVININADPRIAHAINGYGGNEGQLKILLDGIDWTVRNLAALNTSWNPEFAVGNIIRDGEYALGSSFIKEGIGYAAKGAKNTVPAVAAMQRYFRGKQDMSNQMDKYLQEFFENGGETGFTHLSNLNLHEKRAKKMLKRASRGKELRTGENIINQANRFIEMIPRFTTYVASRESGKSIISSVNDAKNITVNFNRRGSGRMADWRTDGVVVSLATFMAPVLSRMQMFANASIQGTANYFGSAKNHPVRWASTTASVAAMGVLSAIISNMLGGDDEPGYEDIPEWVRHSNFTLFNGKNYFSLPLTMEYRPFYTLGESMAMVYLGKSDMKKAAKSVGVSMWDNWNPLSVELFKSGSPTPLLTPFYENLKDEDYKGSKITGRTSWNAYLPEYQRAKKGTGDVFMWISEGLNDVTGGNKYERGGAQVNPSQLEHLVMGWSGGTGRAVSGLYEVIKSTIAGENPELERAPIVRRFYGKVTEENRYRRLRKEFKEKVTEADNLMKSLKRMQKDYENPLDYAARVNEIYRDGEYEKAYNLIEDNKTLRDYEAYYNGSETQEDADDVMKSMIDILEEALKE